MFAASTTVATASVRSSSFVLPAGADANRLVFVEPLGSKIEGAEADNYHVDVGLALGFALPGKRPVGEMNLDPLIEQAPARERRLARLA